MKYFIGGIVLTIIVIAVGAGSFYLGKRQISQTGMIPIPTNAPSIIFSPTPTTITTPNTSSLTRDQERERVVAAVNSKSYVDLQGLMTPTVSVILQATECCGPMTSSQAIAQMSYLDSATPPWNFNQTNPTIVAIKTQNLENYGDSILGISANEYVVAFQLNSDNKIEKISMSVSYKLLVP